MRRIDLVSKLVSPLQVSAFAYVSMNLAIVVAINWAVVSLFVEFYTLKTVRILLEACVG